MRVRVSSFVFCVILFCFQIANTFALEVDADAGTSIDRIQLVTQQINLLKNRYAQSESELHQLQRQNNAEVSQLALEKASKNLLDKAGLDVAVTKSNLDSINIELSDSQQSVLWLEKNIQELENQLNVLGIFGLKVSDSDIANIEEYRADLNYQKNLLVLEKARQKLLLNLQADVVNILQLRKEKQVRLAALLKSKRLLHIRQEQVKDELVYQQKQNKYLHELNGFYAAIAKIDPSKEKYKYATLERSIFYTNEKATYAYLQSLIARYKDQIQQMKLVVGKSNSISLLSEIGDQAQVLSKQVNRLDALLASRVSVLDRHIGYLSKKKHNVEELRTYTEKLSGLAGQYKESNQRLVKLNIQLTELRNALDQALKVELSSRQGFPTFGIKMLLDIGKEALLVPALAFQVVKSLSNNLTRSFQETSMYAWILFAFLEMSLIAVYVALRKVLFLVLRNESAWRERLSVKWLSVQWLRRNITDVFVFANMVFVMWFFTIPFQNYAFLFSLALVWLLFKFILTIARLCLVETTSNADGHDVRLFQRLRWFVMIAGVVTAVTVFMHQLPLIYELKMLCERVFLLLLLGVSVLLLRSWDVVPSLILSHMDLRHPYLQRSVRLVFGFLIPIIMFGNSVIGIFGYMNLVMTVSWYEGVFLVVLIAYLVMRALLSDGIEQLSRLMIMYVHNGWLWTEAFLKPLDRLLRISLFLGAWGLLFLLYGWDKQSPIVERFALMMHYQVAHVLNSSITPINIIELFIVISVFYWTAKWTREFVYRILATRTDDMGLRNSIAIISQYTVVALGILMALYVLGINLRALAFVASMFALGIGMGLRDLINNFACGFLILLERPLRVGDIVNVNGVEGEVTHLGGRAVTVRTWDRMELSVPNAEIFNKPFTNWTARDNIIRTVVPVKISRYDNPHAVASIIHEVLAASKEILKDPAPEVFLKDMNETVMDFEVRFFVNIRAVRSRISVMSGFLMNLWDAFAKHGVKPPAPQHEILLRSDVADLPPTQELLLSKAERS